MPKFIDLTGMSFGRLDVLSRAYKDNDKKTYWKCLCACGAEALVLAHSLRSGNTKSCGCLHKDTVRTHGLSHTPEYAAWHSMMQRCFNVKDENFERYGLRGVTVCQSWRDPKNGFPNFYADLGPRPGAEYSLERLDNDGDYEPANCKWATRVEQRRNRRGAGGEVTASRRFHLYRKTDVSGISGPGVVADGVMFPDGACAIHWRSSLYSIEIFGSIRDLEQIHGHSGRTKIVFDDPPCRGLKPTHTVEAGELVPAL